MTIPSDDASAAVTGSVDHRPVRTAIARILLSDDRLVGLRCTPRQLLPLLNSLLESGASGRGAAADAKGGGGLVFREKMIVEAFGNRGDEFEIKYTEMGIEEGGGGELRVRVGKQFGAGQAATDIGYFAENFSGSNETLGEHPLDDWKQFQCNMNATLMPAEAMNDLIAFLERKHEAKGEKKRKKKDNRKKKKRKSKKREQCKQSRGSEESCSHSQAAALGSDCNVGAQMKQPGDSVDFSTPSSAVELGDTLDTSNGKERIERKTRADDGGSNRGSDRCDTSDRIKSAIERKIRVNDARRSRGGLHVSETSNASAVGYDRERIARKIRANDKGARPRRSGGLDVSDASRASAVSNDQERIERKIRASNEGAHLRDSGVVDVLEVSYDQARIERKIRANNEGSNRSGGPTRNTREIESDREHIPTKVRASTKAKKMSHHNRRSNEEDDGEEVRGRRRTNPHRQSRMDVGASRTTIRQKILQTSQALSQYRRWSQEAESSTPIDDTGLDHQNIDHGASVNEVVDPETPDLVDTSCRQLEDMLGEDAEIGSSPCWKRQRVILLTTFCTFLAVSSVAIGFAVSKNKSESNDVVTYNEIDIAPALTPSTPPTPTESIEPTPYCTRITINVVGDIFQRWELLRSNSDGEEDVVAKSLADTKYADSFCLPDGKYKFIIDDGNSFLGSGGYHTIKVSSGEVIAQGDDFGGTSTFSIPVQEYIRDDKSAPQRL